MATRRQIVEKAREYIGVPWLHQGRSKTLGVDCIGLIICVAYELNLLPRFDYPANYPRHPDGYWFQALLEQHMVRVRKKNDAKEGDVLLFRSDEHPCHVALLVSQEEKHRRMIHALVRVPHVVTEHLLGSDWWDRVVAAYRFPQNLEE